MKIGVLEWVCGSGLAQTESSILQQPCQDENDELQREGWAMLACLVSALTAAGHQVVAPLNLQLARFPHQSLGTSFKDQFTLVETTSGLQDVCRQWSDLIQSCDCAIVIAPEIHSVLENVLNRLRSISRVPLINCQGNCLEVGGNKLTAAVQFQREGIPHPPTMPLTETTEDWLASVAGVHGNQHWVVKPADGAGCHGLSRLTLAQLRITCQRSADINGNIVQPWLLGEAYSVSAIVDARGKWHWLPLATQIFQRVGSGLSYIGGAILADTTHTHIADSTPQPARPDSLLAELAQRLDGAFGWVSVDLLYNRESDHWTVLEVNPRCTTSILGLQQAYSGNLIAELIEASKDVFTGLSGHWQPAKFSAGNNQAALPLPTDDCGTGSIAG